MPEGIPIIFSRSGTLGRAYKARVTIWCDCCGRVISAGKYYARHRLSVSGTLQAVCDVCRPFRLIEIPESASLPVDAATVVAEGA
jgi:hypothetical protein